MARKSHLKIAHVAVHVADPIGAPSGYKEEDDEEDEDDSDASEDDGDDDDEEDEEDPSVPILEGRKTPSVLIEEVKVEWFPAVT